jgi:hypothetical protein
MPPRPPATATLFIYILDWVCWNDTHDVLLLAQVISIPLVALIQAVIAVRSTTGKQDEQSRRNNLQKAGFDCGGARGVDAKQPISDESELYQAYQKLQ